MGVAPFDPDEESYLVFCIREYVLPITMFFYMVRFLIRSIVVPLAADGMWRDLRFRKEKYENEEEYEEEEEEPTLLENEINDSATSPQKQIEDDTSSSLRHRSGGGQGEESQLKKITKKKKDNSWRENNDLVACRYFDSNGDPR